MNETILLVEDEADDVLLLKHAFNAVGILNPLTVARDGKEAMDYLGGSGAYADRERFPLPCLTMLDLKLPRVMGLELLRWIRNQPKLKTLIVIILTSSRVSRDVEQAYQLGANAYLVKPSSPPELREIAVGIKQFWLGLNQGPAMGQPSSALASGGDSHLIRGQYETEISGLYKENLIWGKHPIESKRSLRHSALMNPQTFSKV